MTLEELQIKVTAKTDGIESKMSRLNSKFAELGKSSQNAGKGIGKAFQNIDKAIKASAIGAVVVFIVKAISKMSQFVGECTKLGSDLAEVQNVVDVTFGDMANQVNNFASNSIKDLGMSETACKKYTSTMGAMLKSSGFDTSSALTMSKTITQLTADMASFYNLGTEEAFEKIRSGISGEVEPLRQLGINMSVANLEAYALSQGIQKSYSKMSQSEQTLLRYNYLLSVTGDAQGDLARTSNSWANQTRILKEQWSALMGSFGQGFINILTPVVKGLNIILEKLKVVGEWFAKVTGYVFGEADTGSSGGGIVDTSIYDNATDGALGLGDAIGDAGDAAEKAGKQAKKGLLSFDEVNQLNDSSGSGGSGGSGSAGDLSNTEGLGNALNNVGTMADTLTNKVGTLKKDTDSWLDKLIELLGKVADGIADIVSKLLSIKPDMGLNWDSNKNTTKDNITNEITNYSATFDDAAATECMTRVQALKQKIDATLNKPSYIKVLLIEGDLVARVQAIQIILDSLKDKVVTISCIGDLSVLDAAILKLGSLDAIANTTLNGALKRLWEFIKGSFKADTSLALTLVSNNGQTAFKTLGSFMDSCKKTGDEVSNFFKNVFTGNFSGAFENVKNAGTTWKEHLINCFVNAKENCNANTEALRSWVVSKWENLKTLVTGHSTSMKDKTTSDTSTMKAKFTDLGSYVSGTFATKIGSGCTSISTKFSSMWSSIKTGCTSALNYMIDKINGLTSKLNSKLNFTLPSVLGGGHVGFSIPQIPRLARGGIVDGATNFGNYIAGEAGKEMIVPLENTSFVNTLASALGNAVMYAMSTSLQNSNTGNDGQDIKLEMDGMTFARSITPYIIKEMQRVGVEL